MEKSEEILSRDLISFSTPEPAERSRPNLLVAAEPPARSLLDESIVEEPRNNRELSGDSPTLIDTMPKHCQMVGDHSETIEEVKRDIVRLEEGIIRKETEMEMEMEGAKLQTTIKQHNDDASVYRSQLQRLQRHHETECALWAEEKIKLLGRLESANAQLLKSTEELESLQTVRNDNDQLKASLASLQEQLDAFQTVAHDQAVSSEEAINAKDQEIDLLKKRVEYLEAACHQADATEAGCEEMIVDLERRIQQLQDQAPSIGRNTAIPHLQLEVNILHKEQEEQKVALSAMEAEFNRLRQTAQTRASESQTMGNGNGDVGSREYHSGSSGVLEETEIEKIRKRLDSVGEELESLRSQSPKRRKFFDTPKANGIHERESAFQSIHTFI